MPRYSFYQRSNDWFVWDEEGVDLSDPPRPSVLPARSRRNSAGACCMSVAVTGEGDQVIHVITL